MAELVAALAVLQGTDPAQLVQETAGQVHAGGLALKDVLAPIAIGISALIAGAALAFNIATNKFIKSADVMMKCWERYDEIHTERAKLPDNSNRRPDDSKQDHVAVETIYKRFWSLQHFQHEMFLLGLIEQDVYQQWMIHKVRLFRETTPIGGYTLAQSWTTFGVPNNSENTAFQELFYSLLNVSETPDTDPNIPHTRTAVRKLVVDHEAKYGRCRRWKWFRRGLVLPFGR